MRSPHIGGRLVVSSPEEVRVVERSHRPVLVPEGEDPGEEHNLHRLRRALALVEEDRVEARSLRRLHWVWVLREEVREEAHTPHWVWDREEDLGVLGSRIVVALEIPEAVQREVCSHFVQIGEVGDTAVVVVVGRPSEARLPWRSNFAEAPEMRQVAGLGRHCHWLFLCCRSTL